MRSCEVLINIMTSAMVRWIHAAEFEGALDELFGCPHWRTLRGLPEVDLEPMLTALYCEQLGLKAKYVWSFKMLNGKHRPIYNLVFGTNALLGLERMKESMWKVSPSPYYAFSDKYVGTTAIFGGDDISALRAGLRHEMQGKTILIDQLTHHVITKTPYLRGHLKQKTLQPMEAAGEIEVTRPAGKTRGYPEGTRIRFL